MKETEDVSSVLQSLLRNEEFIISLMKGMNEFSTTEMERKLGIVISYYIITRDANTGYTYEEIESKYSEVSKQPLEPGTTYYRNAVEKGFFTHSFNGYKKDRISRYGLNYMGKIDDEQTISSIKVARERLEMLETMLGRSKFVEDTEYGDEHTSDEVFLTTAGTKTINYACRFAPERLYLGPLKQEEGEEEPIIVGETKQEYMFRVLAKKIKKKYTDKNSEEYLMTMQLAKDVTEYYCSKSPSFALMSMDKISDMPISHSVFRPLIAEPLKNFVNSQSIRDVQQFFSTRKRRCSRTK